MDHWMWSIWLLSAIALLIAEVFVSGFFLGSLALASIASGVAAGLRFGSTVQLGTFVGAAAISLVAFRPTFEALFHPQHKHVATNVAALIGQGGIVKEPIRGRLRPGRVLVGGDDWRAIPVGDSAIAEGSDVIVVSVSGATLTVRRKD